MRAYLTVDDFWQKATELASTIFVVVVIDQRIEEASTVCCSFQEDVLTSYLASSFWDGASGASEASGVRRVLYYWYSSPPLKILLDSIKRKGSQGDCGQRKEVEETGATRW